MPDSNPTVEYVVECEEADLGDVLLVLPRTSGKRATVHERLVRCKDCRFTRDGGYCSLWQKRGLGGEHFCSYGEVGP